MASFLGSHTEGRAVGGMARGATKGALRSYLGSSVHAAGMDWVKFDLGFGKLAGKGASRFLGPAFLAYSAYEGYKHGGASGAAREVGSNLATSYAFGAVTKALRLGAIGQGLGYVALGVGVGIAGGMAGEWALGGVSPLAAGGLFSFAARPWVHEHMRKLERVDMGRPVIDQFGTLATMRQRSLAAIQNSKINGRSAVGSEAALMFRPYFR